MSTTYAGMVRVDADEQKKLREDLTPEEIQAYVKRLTYAGNGVSVGFSVIFNMLAGGNPTKEDAFEGLEKLNEEFRKVLGRYYDHELEFTEKDGIRVAEIKHAVKFN
jgi:hypothetical protein